MAHFAKRELETVLCVGQFFWAGAILVRLILSFPFFFLVSIDSRTRPCLGGTSSKSTRFTASNCLIGSRWFSSFHYHVLSGILFPVCYALHKLDYYPQAFSSRIQYTAQHTPQIRRTSQAPSGPTSYSSGLVLVSGSCVLFLTSVVRTDSRSTRVAVRRAVQPEHTSDSAQSASAGLEEACYSTWIRLWATLMPQLLFRKRGMGRRCLYDGILGRCVAFLGLLFGLLTIST
jgi:hypothetical protein